MNKDEKRIFLLLHDIRSVYNVGAIFRTAEAAGAEKIFLSGYTPGPEDRFGRIRKDFHKSALGAELLVPWEFAKDYKDILGRLKAENFRIVALEQDPRSQTYDKFKTKSNVVLVVGNETGGLPKELLENSDSIIEIPMKGKKESLNVSVALGIALFELIK